MNYELTIRQSFAKLRRIWGSNFVGERRNQANMNMEERGAFYRRGGGSPKGGVRQPLGENLLLFMVVIPSSWW
jgi:hypothetical protein